MAIYHLTASAGSRSGGVVAAMKYDYIAREGRYEEDDPGREEDGRGEVRHLESGNMPEWAADRPRSYWAAADEHERANGRLFREIHVALPAELSRSQQKELGAGTGARHHGEQAAAVHPGDPRGGREGIGGASESARPPGVVGPGPRRPRSHGRDLVPALQREGSGEGGRAEARPGERSALAVPGPGAVGRPGEPGARTRRPRGAGRSPEPGGPGRRGGRRRRHGDGGEAAPRAERPPRTCGDAGRRADGDGEEPPQTVVRALQIEERNAVLPDLAAEEKSLRRDLKRLEDEDKDLRWDLGESEARGRQGDARRAGGHLRAGSRPLLRDRPRRKTSMTGDAEKVLQAMRGPEPARPKTPQRGPERGPDMSR